ncbi:hypothetical protein JK361_06590 [Streptomyces sp. 5-8]|uniref:Uncharacterized protein n=1 Tax=Streptomyces musisoli TaxID=2802280 RepID=A0ABS1NX50_9ACTN|nr:MULTISPECIES: hypothetical protein [Streptomyces]MBL1104276.1 hypothetical protein [Streptomyces musisoli]MBY8844432.1 hypothetical protein [Streptomyces sp. SP2-10]
MTKRFSALAVSAVIAGGFLMTSVPAHAATSAGHGAVVSKAAVTCNKGEMRQQIANLKRKAAQLKQLGEPAAARKALDQAAAIQRRLDACIKAEDEAAKPFPG